MTLTAATVQRDFLHPALDARAQNLLQGRLVYNPDTPEPDSILELFQWLLHRRPDLLEDPEIAEKAADALQCIRQIVVSNQLEGGGECRFIGAADSL
jgi:hypothetical protein